ncbi:MAG TPA: hypothetical protein VFL56_01490 [Solirubrobacterales bacterium]|nr:hypothetical protein [Solirubrobacterales bacterium]
MPLKVVPAGDERCDVHNHRTPQRYVCEECLKEFGIESPESATVHRPPRRVRWRRARRRWRSRIDRRKVLLGAAAVVALIVAGLIAGSVVGGGEGGGGAPSEADVVNRLDLLPNPAGTGWITSDGACAVVEIDLSELPPPTEGGEELSIEASNETRTVGAVVIQNDFSIGQAECVARVDAALKAEF